MVMGEDLGKAEGLEMDTLSVVAMEEGPVTLVGVEVLSVVTTPWDEGHGVTDVFLVCGYG